MGIENTKIIFLRSNNVDHSGAFGMTINDILTDKCNEDLKRLICCEYQRPYTWKNQIIDLIGDIEKCGDNSFHFIGILYFGLGCVNRGKPIIDGQQRIITIFLILYHLRNSNNFIINVKINDSYFSLNEIIEDSNVSKQSTLLNEYKKSMDVALKDIKKYFCDKNREFKENFVNKLLNQLYFLAIVCTDKKMEQALFMDINSKGIKLDDIDKIKAFLLLIYKDNLSSFIKQWAILNKKGKGTINLFLKILMNAVCEGKDSSGKVKYEKFIEKVNKDKEKDKNLDNFKIKFNQAIERFKIIPCDDIEMFNPNFADNKFDRNKKNIYASIYLARSLRAANTFVQEITHEKRYKDYVSGKRHPIILFLLYILSHICEMDFSFKNADSRRKIAAFQNWDEKIRKEEVLRLWAKAKGKDGESLLDKIEYKISGINDDHPKITEKNKCIFSLLIISLSKYLDFYEQIEKNKNADIDHIIPKKILFNKEPNIPKNKKSLLYKFNGIDDDELKKLICSIYNTRLMTASGNRGKSSFLDEKFCIKDNANKIIGIDYVNIRDFLNKNKEELIKNLDEVILKLTK